MSVMTPDQLLNDPTNPRAPITLAGTQYSRALVFNGASRGSFELIHTGTATTAVTLWGTNVPPALRDDTTDTSWVDLSGSVTVPNQPAGAASKSLLQLADVSCQELRYKLVTASGTGTAFCWGKVAE